MSGLPVLGILVVHRLLLPSSLLPLLMMPFTWGAIAGFLAGFGWAAMGLGVVALFERRSWKYSMINGGYLTVALTLMGLILGAWRK